MRAFISLLLLALGTGHATAAGDLEKLFQEIARPYYACEARVGLKEIKKGTSPRAYATLLQKQCEREFEKILASTLVLAHVSPKGYTEETKKYLLDFALDLWRSAVVHYWEELKRVHPRRDLRPTCMATAFECAMAY